MDLINSFTNHIFRERSLVEDLFSLGLAAAPQFKGILGAFEHDTHTMNLLENFDNNMIFVENAENTMDLLGDMDCLEENLWEALRSYCQYFNLDYPLPVENKTPPCGQWFSAQPQIFQDEAYGLTQQHQTAPVVEVIDDDIAIISSNIFDQARKKARRNPDAAVRENINIANQVRAARRNPNAAVRENINMANQARGVPRFHGFSQALSPSQFPGLSQAVPPPQFPGLSHTVPPAPAPAPVFCCPICLDELKEATSTKCGHVFCKNCIEKALAFHKKCPTCRMKCRAKSISRIFLPAVL